MSGGLLNYHILNDTIEEIKDIIKNNGVVNEDEWDEYFDKGYSKETISEFNKAIEIFRLASIYMKRIDYLLEGDDSEDSFHKRLIEDLIK